MLNLTDWLGALNKRREYPRKSGREQANQQPDQDRTNNVTIITLKVIDFEDYIENSKRYPDAFLGR
jgi:hypothetical protein